MNIDHMSSKTHILLEFVFLLAIVVVAGVVSSYVRVNPLFLIGIGFLMGGLIAFIISRTRNEYVSVAKVIFYASMRAIVLLFLFSYFI